MIDCTHGIFLRMEPYALVAAARKAGGNTLQKVAAEAMRLGGHCEHVKNPQVPLVIFGKSPLLLIKEHENRSAKARSKYFHKPSGTFLTRKQRRDRPVAVAGVISVPDTWAESEPRWQLFKDVSTQWLILQFGEQHLHCVLEHLDEPCLHLHFFLNPLENESFEAVHPGFNALKALKSNASPSERKAAYENAMRALLDCFHQDVGQHFGLVRRHVGAKRMSREDWQIWNWYRQRARLREELVAKEVREATAEKLLMHAAQKSAHAIDPEASPENVVRIQKVGPVLQVQKDAGIGISKAGSFIKRKVTTPGEFKFPDLATPSHSITWYRQRNS